MELAYLRATAATGHLGSMICSQNCSTALLAGINICCMTDTCPGAGGLGWQRYRLVAGTF
jgi:hypothetical protein